MNRKSGNHLPDVAADVTIGLPVVPAQIVTILYYKLQEGRVQIDGIQCCLDMLRS